MTVFWCWIVCLFLVAMVKLIALLWRSGPGGIFPHHHWCLPHLFPLNKVPLLYFPSVSSSCEVALTLRPTARGPFMGPSEIEGKHKELPTQRRGPWAQPLTPEGCVWDAPRHTGPADSGHQAPPSSGLDLSLKPVQLPEQPQKDSQLSIAKCAQEKRGNDVEPWRQFTDRCRCQLKNLWRVSPM